MLIFIDKWQIFVINTLGSLSSRLLQHACLNGRVIIVTSTETAYFSIGWVYFRARLKGDKHGAEWLNSVASNKGGETSSRPTRTPVYDQYIACMLVNRNSFLVIIRIIFSLVSNGWFCAMKLRCSCLITRKMQLSSPLAIPELKIKKMTRMLSLRTFWALQSKIFP